MRQVGQVDQPEVDDLRYIRGDQDISRLEVAVHQAGVVDRGQRCVDTAPDLPDAGSAQRSAGVHHLLQRQARDQFDGEPGQAFKVAEPGAGAGPMKAGM